MKRRHVLIAAILGICLLVLSFFCWNYLLGNSLAYLPKKYDDQTINKIYFSKQSKTIEVELEDPIQKIHKQWYAQNRKDWRVDFNTYLPGIIVIAGEIRFNFIVETNTVVADFPVLSDKRTQLAKKIDIESLISYSKAFNRLMSVGSMNRESPLRRVAGSTLNGLLLKSCFWCDSCDSGM
jgi:hypothetical protein